MAAARCAIPALAVLVLLSGCGSVTGPGTPTATDPTTAVSPTPTTESTPPDETSTPTKTHRPTPERNIEHEVAVRNDANETVTVFVRISHDETGEVIFERNVTLEPDEGVEFQHRFAETGDYVVSVRAGGKMASTNWEVSHPDPDGEAVIVIRPGGEIYLTITYV